MPFDTIPAAIIPTSNIDTQSATTSTTAANMTSTKLPAQAQSQGTAPSNKKRVTKDKPDQKYAPTLLLPKTDFPLRADAVNREPQFRQRSTSDLYAWQVAKIECWDCHGLPIELKALSELKVADRSSLSPTEVRAVAQATAQSTVDAQRDSFQSYAVMGDWSNGYKTMDKDFETRQLKVFYEMMNKGLIYRANKPVYWSPSSKTALAESELEYKDDHKSQSAWVAFYLHEPSAAILALLPKGVPLQVQAVVWTTTPWTLPANRCVAVHPKMSYTLFRTNGASESSTTMYLAATERMNEMEKRFASKESPIMLEPLAQIMGDKLVGTRYQHPLTGESMPFITADYVTSDSGSGLVHTAPGHGMDDYKACSPLGIEAFCPVDDLGVFTAEAGPELEGLQVQGEGTTKVLEMLKAKGTLIQQEAYVHKYPYDWRTKKPIILRATSQWFANVGSVKEDALKAVENVRIVPEAARRRLEGFVHSRSEWCISRQRSWGVPIPVMYDDETGEPLMTKESVQHVIGIVQEHGADAWWSMTTEELLAPQYRDNSRVYRRGTDTMDVWFDSGTSWTMIEEKMPRPEKSFVADVYCEGSDQHRGWFQSSLLTSVALTGKAPYGTLITHGFLLDEKGFKQSKSLGNTVDPAVVIYGGKNLQKDPAYGTDVLRLWVASSEYTKDVAIGKTILTQVADALRKFRTTARFMLGNLNGFEESDAVPYEQLSFLDKYMLSEVYHFCKSVDAAYSEFAFNKVFNQLQYLTSTTLSAFYFDVVKDTLYSESEKSLKRRSVQTALFHILNAFNKSLAPMTPHFSEEVYENYRSCFTSPQPSVFRTGWIDVPEQWNDLTLREEFVVVRFLRTEVNQLLEQARTAKLIGSSLEADVELQFLTSALGTKDSLNVNLDTKQSLEQVVAKYKDDFARYFITSKVKVSREEAGADDDKKDTQLYFKREVVAPCKDGSCRLIVRRALLNKCPRCWTFTSVDQDALCPRCGPVVASLDT
ncbi:hypothetical protein BGW38_001232 [Lunasporangiospora selenospora]|uniref:isoleucine--tRNA ligase n=1 Tax=Lunasporangiospora selenospora TaxID=979761 RepID=A0A9P6KDN9_9FUNG|nr:hypothetical protein BGW38_001232 [Lunasporangiospora selenospora]